MARVARVRLAETVASTLRERIISGTLADGDRLASVERLSADYGVGLPAIREALRVLENEGLITVTRGNQGGAVVHRPTAEAVAYPFSLLLRSSRAPARDVADALGSMEALCAAWCARRPDRERAVVPVLRDAHHASEALLDGPGLPFTAGMQTFHRLVISSCGNRTLAYLGEVLSRVWASQEETWERHADERPDWPPRELRLRGLDFHSRLVEAIRVGDAELAQALMEELAEHPMNYGPSVGPRLADAPDVRFTGRVDSAKGNGG